MAKRKPATKNPIGLPEQPPAPEEPAAAQAPGSPSGDPLPGREEVPTKRASSEPPAPGGKAPTLMEIVKAGNFDELLRQVSNTGIDKIASQKNGFWASVLEHFHALSQREAILQAILDKIDAHEGSQASRDFKNNKTNRLKAETWLLQGENFLNIIKQDGEAALTIPAAKKTVETLQRAYFAYHLLSESALAPGTKTKFFDLQVKAEKTMREIIESATDQKEQFALYELALLNRKANFPGQEHCFVDLLIQLGSCGTKSSDLGLKFKAIEYNNQAYNIICSHQLDKEEAQSLVRVLANLEKLYVQLGDQEKGDLLARHHNHIKQKFPSDEKHQYIGLKQEGYTPIPKRGEVDSQTLAIKKQIQEGVLNKIQAAAARSKWTEVKFFIEYGVQGYLGEDWLKAQLGDFASDENYKIALKLCFEAINIGIMNSRDHNPLCAAIFCIKYPEIVREILDKHPEYFIDGRILRASSVLPLAGDGQKLTGIHFEENDNSYNKYFEQQMTQFIKTRIQNSLLEPVGLIIQKDEWSSAIKENLLSKLSDQSIAPALGNNLSQMPEVFSIARILILEEIIEATQKNGSSNFNPVATWAAQYPDLAKRVLEDHPELLKNEALKLCLEKHAQSLGREGAPDAGEPAEPISGGDAVEIEPEDIAALGSLPVVSSSEAEG